MFLNKTLNDSQNDKFLLQSFKVSFQINNRKKRKTAKITIN